MHPELIDRLRSDLTAAGFGVEALHRLWGAEADAALARGFRVPALRATAEDASPLAVLARLFVLGVPSAESDAGRALPRLGLAGAESLELLRTEGAQAHPLVDLRPYSFVDAHGAGEWWIASDLGETAVAGPLREDHVLGVGGASLTLSGMMLPRPVGSVLDLGTGCGIQALHASRLAERVVATDISARALRFARFNAALNAVTGIEFRLGSLFEPVEGDRFDLVVSNPPFVITPRTGDVPAYEYRDAGLTGDSLLEEVVRSVGDHLTPGGVAQLLGNWEYRRAGHEAGQEPAKREDGLDRVRSWASGLDAWVIERGAQDPAEYAETWIRDGGLRAGDPRFDRLYRAWLDDFGRRGVERIGLGWLLLRRPRRGIVLERFERLPGGTAAGGAGEHLAAALEAHDRIAELDDSRLGGLRLVVAPDVTEERHHWPGEEHPTAIQLRQGAGFARTIPVGTAAAGFVGACDGSLPVGQLIGALAEVLETDEDALHRELMPQVRELVICGILIPTAPGGDAQDTWRRPA